MAAVYFNVLSWLCFSSSKEELLSAGSANGTTLPQWSPTVSCLSFQSCQGLQAPISYSSLQRQPLQKGYSDRGAWILSLRDPMVGVRFHLTQFISEQEMSKLFGLWHNKHKHAHPVWLISCPTTKASVIASLSDGTCGCCSKPYLTWTISHIS